MSATLSYVYAVARSVGDAAVRDLRGVSDGSVRVVGADGLVGVVGDVDRAEFEAHALEEQLSDLTWLERTARAHHHVVDSVGRAHVVAPLALATVFYDDERVRGMLERGRVSFVEVLDLLTGRGEWGVKAYATPRGEGQHAGKATRGAGSGTEYLRRRRDELRAADRGTEVATEAAEEIHAAALGVAVDGRRHRLQDASLTGRSDPMVLNGAYLVGTAAVDDFRAVLARWAEDPRVRVELTGPWVPYSFAQVSVP